MMAWYVWLQLAAIATAGGVLMYVRGWHRG